MGVVPLDAAAGGHVVTRRGEGQAAGAADGQHALDERLAPAGLADDQAAIMVLHGAGDDLAGAGRHPVDEDDEGEGIQLGALAGAGLDFVPAIAALLAHDELVGAEELAADADGGIQNAAAVEPQVEDQLLHALKLQGGDGPLEFLRGGLAEGLDLDESGGGIQHEAEVDAVCGHLGPRDGEVHQLLEPGPLDGELHEGALLSPQLLDGAIGGHALGAGAVDLLDDVTRPHAQALGGAALHGTDDGDALVVLLDDGADAEERALLLLSQHPELAFVHVVRVGV